MLKVKRLGVEDVDHIKALHEKYYSEFEFPDFFNKFISAFAITDEDDEIIIAGGVRPIAEVILITDQTKSRIKIGKALMEAQHISVAATIWADIDELHAFVNNEEYASHLIQHGFSPRSRALSMKVL